MDPDGAAAALLDRRLRRLKQRGCNLLIRNDAPGAATICDHLVGDPERRSRLFVPTTTTVASVVDRHRPAPLSPERLAVVDATTTRRTRAVVESLGPTGDAEWYSDLGSLDDLETLGHLADEHLDRLASAGPGSVRVCLESLDPFLDAVAPERLFRFLDHLTERIRRCDGMGHVHVAAGTDEETVERFVPLFDATLDVHTVANDTVRMRLTLRDSGQQTDWLTLER